ncbi:MAG: sterol desaturase family protein [Gammaproteobacteria bacterium]|nr:sterol desaturase family protein [Gammaproteobacteria bacterium]
MTLEEFIIQNENTIRISVFASMLAIMGIWELVTPRRAPKISKLLRWANNLGLTFLNSFLQRFIFPMAATGMALFANQQGWGLFNYIDLNPLLEIIIAIILLDLIIYLQHVLVHAIPALWRLHRVHHADLDYDVTTGSRFHPIEIFISLLIKLASITVFGPAVVAVIIFEVLLNGMAMFNHGNVGLPPKLDKLLRFFIVTPDMHRVHHSVEDDETNSNFGFNLSCWDRLFGTYREQPRKGHVSMNIGIRGFAKPQQSTWLHGLLIMPFIGKISGYTINRREWNAEDKN